MDEIDNILKILQDKKEKLSDLTNNLLGLYRRLLEEKIDYKNENKYDGLIAEQRTMMKTLETEIKALESVIKKSEIKKIEKKIREYRKNKKK